MNTTKPTLKFQIDIVDFQDDKDILDTIKNLLKLIKDREFFDSVSWDEGEKISVEVSPKISFLISGCDCE
jgi:hypothetical protein